jgi:hypothetical protein
MSHGPFPDGSLVGGTWRGLSRERKVAQCVWALHKHATGDRRATGTVGEWLELLDDALDGGEMPADVLRGDGLSPEP